PGTYSCAGWRPGLHYSGFQVGLRRGAGRLRRALHRGQETSEAAAHFEPRSRSRSLALSPHPSLLHRQPRTRRESRALRQRQPRGRLAQRHEAPREPRRLCTPPRLSRPLIPSEEWARRNLSRNISEVQHLLDLAQWLDKNVVSHYIQPIG